MSTVVTLPALPFPSATSANPWSASSESSKPSAKIPLLIRFTTCASPFAAAAPSPPSSRKSTPILPGRELRRVPRKLFRRLGVLRDAQVMDDWVKHLAPEARHASPKAPRALHRKRCRTPRQTLCAPSKNSTSNRGRASKEKSAAASASSRRRASPRNVSPSNASTKPATCTPARSAPTIRSPGTSSASASSASATPSKILLPNHYVLWSKNLKRLQDLLGDVHDLDVLADVLKIVVAQKRLKRRARRNTTLTDAHHVWQEIIHRERNERVETYRQLTLGKTSLWNDWRHGLPQGQAPRARLHGTPSRDGPRHGLAPASHRENFSLLDHALRRTAPRARRARLRRAKHAPRHARRRALASRRRSPPRQARANVQRAKPRADSSANSRCHQVGRTKSGIC